MVLPLHKWLNVELSSATNKFIITVNTNSAGNKKLVATNTLSGANRFVQGDTVPVTIPNNVGNILQDYSTGDIFYVDLSKVIDPVNPPTGYDFIPCDIDYTTNGITGDRELEFDGLFGAYELDIYPLTLTLDETGLTNKLGTGFRITVPQVDQMKQAIRFHGDTEVKQDALYGSQVKVFAEGGFIWVVEPYECPLWADKFSFERTPIPSYNNFQYADSVQELPRGYAGSQIQNFAVANVGLKDWLGGVISQFDLDGNRLSGRTVNPQNRIALLNELRYPFNNNELATTVWNNAGNREQLNFLSFLTDSDDLGNFWNKFVVYSNVVDRYLIQVFANAPSNGYHLVMWDLEKPIQDNPRKIARWRTQDGVGFYGFPRTPYEMVGSAPFPIDEVMEKPGFSRPPTIGIDSTDYTSGDPSTIDFFIIYESNIVRWNLNSPGEASPDEGHPDLRFSRPSNRFGTGTLTRTFTHSDSGSAAVFTPPNEVTAQCILKRAGNTLAYYREAETHTDGTVVFRPGWNTNCCFMKDPPDFIFNLNFRPVFRYGGKLYRLSRVVCEDAIKDRIFFCYWDTVEDGTI